MTTNNISIDETMVPYYGPHGIDAACQNGWQIHGMCGKSNMT